MIMIADSCATAAWGSSPTGKVDMKPVVALNSNDPELYLLLQHILEAEGYDLRLISGIEDLDHLLEIKKLHAVLLDCASDSCGALDICSRLKGAKNSLPIPVAALIPPQGDTQHIQLIKAGIDDGMLRPLAPSRLLQFLRSQPHVVTGVDELGTLAEGKLLQEHILEMDMEAKRVYCSGRHIELPPIGFRLLACFLKYPDRVHSREALIMAGWRETAPVNQRAVDIHIGRLRRNLRSISGFNMIRTVRSVGYTLQTDTVTTN
ncbi:DNA-binding response regulator [Mesorhizobium sp. DCY119]|nr:DNA-binding response regulator [Mesorhizobium sp. DCY119]